MILNFWWGAQAGSRKTHWIKKDLFLKHQLDGGLGFKNMISFNLALLAKQGWNIIRNPASLLAKVLKARYFSNCDLISASATTTASFVLKSIHSALGILRQGTSFDVSRNLYVCQFSNNEEFSVKLTYNFIEACNIRSAQIAGPSSNFPIEKF